MRKSLNASKAAIHQEPALLFYSLVIIAAVVLIPLLPIGTYLGLGSTLFSGFFILHLFLLACAIGFGTSLLFNYSRNLSVGYRLALLTGVAALALSLIESTLPVTFRDAQIHHLAVPQWWVARGEIYSPNWHEWSHYPMLINLAYAGFFQLEIPTGPAYYHWTLQLLFSCTLLLGCAQVLKSIQAGAIAFLLATTLPILHRLAAIPLVDCGLALYSAVAFFSVLMLYQADTKTPEAKKIVLALVIGVALGLALSTKYNGLPFALSLGLLFLFLMARSALRETVTYFIIICASSLIIYSPWLIRNYYLTSNPIYPLYNNLFPPTIERPSGLPSLKPLEQRMLIYQESALDIALLPIRIFFEGEDNQPSRFDGVLSPLLILSLLTAFILRSSRIFAFSLALTFLYFLLALFLNPLRIRYLIPIIAPLIFLSSALLDWLLNKTRTTQVLATSLLTLNIAFFANYAFGKLKQEKLLPYLSGKISTAQYLNEKIAEYPMIDYINQNIAANKKIYLLFTGNRFSLYHPLVFSGGHFSASFLLDWIRSSTKTREPLTQKLRSRHIDYILADSVRAQSFVTEQLNEEERALWTSFVREHLKLIQEERGFSLWQVIE
jgi:hypothetical protein